MIEFFLQPGRVKGLLIGGGAALAVAVSLLIGCICLSGRLDTERADHKTTREKLATAVLEGNRWKAVAEAAEPKITALQGAVRDCLDRETGAQADATARDRIMAGVIPTKRSLERGLPKASPVTAKENKNEVTIIDDATRKQAVDRLNRPL